MPGSYLLFLLFQPMRISPVRRVKNRKKHYLIRPLKAPCDASGTISSVIPVRCMLQLFFNTKLSLTAYAQ